MSTTQQSVGQPRNAGITLEISPTISPNNYLRLNVSLEVSRFVGAFDPNSVTGGGVTLRRQIKTQVTMPSDSTMVIGGVTRLTHSGLSIVEWQPLVGTVPPLSHAEWLEVFEKYKQTPEYQQVNHSMSLNEFKGILWGQRLRVYTDHKNLIQDAFGLTSEHVYQWRLLLEEYSPKIMYRKRHTKHCCQCHLLIGL